MKIPKGVSYILLSAAAGLLATFAVQRYVAAKTQVPVVPTGQVAVAAEAVAPGNSLTAGMVKEVIFPKNLVPANAASSFKEVEDRVVATRMEKGEPIILTKLAPKGTAAGLSGLLGEDKRALTVRVDDVTGVAGFIHPGDRVDVLADFKVPKTDDFFSKTILQNVTVLSIGQTWEEQKGERKPVLVNTVTLELTPEQAEILNLVAYEGKIRLALRNRSYQKEDVTSGVAISQLLSLRAPKKEEAPPPVVKKGRKGVEMIKGLDRSEVEL
ncbi:MAG: Flp pilus assembly protein CpaB [Deltaproteobacteria bacterium]|nr:Flp pilus assembly protein CpaB [Deltaproteobacteria bacterium]